MKLSKLTSYFKLLVLGFLFTTVFNACQNDELITEAPESTILSEEKIEADNFQYSERSGSGFLITHENCGGHTIERHIAKSDAYLRNRLNTSRISAASTFYELNQAGQVIYNAITRNSSRVNNWLNGSGGSRLVLDYSHRKNIGKVLKRGASRPYSTRKFRVVLERRNCSGYGYKILTAYPN